MEIKEIPFIAPCPCQKCISSSKLYEWKHECGKIFSLTKEGTLKCPDPCCSSDEKETPFINYEFKCDNPNTDREPTQEGTCHSLSELLKQDRSPKEKEFIIHMMSFFMEEFLRKVREGLNKNPSITFESLCPTEKCTNQTVIQWYHKECGGHLKLTIENEVPILECSNWRCSIKKGVFNKWKFQCDEKYHNEKMCSVPGVCKAFTKLARENPGYNALLMKMSAKIIEGIRKSSENYRNSNNNNDKLVAVPKALVKK